MVPQSSNLFLLVGTNPLPNYVAAKILLKRDGHLYLVHSDDTARIADRLIAIMEMKKSQVTKIEVRESAGDHVFEQVEKHVKGKKEVGLNYTGGTKTMSVHAYQAVKVNCPEAVFSYLDARTLSLIVEHGEQPCQSYPVGLAVKPTIDTLLALHGYTLKQPKEKKVFGIELARALTKIDVREFRSWCNSNIRIRDERGKSKIKKKEVDEIQLPSCIDWSGAKIVKDLAFKWGKDLEEVVRWLDGLWLEHYTLWSLMQIADSCHIHDIARSILPIERNFEFDVVAMRGYQLFAISCSTESRKRDLKLKLFEAYVRARQLGGDEARIGLVCCAPENEPDNNPAIIQGEIEESWDVEGKVRVFGSAQLSNLQMYLQDWFNSQR